MTARPIVGLLLDIRYAARTLRRSPAVTLVAVLTLALTIGVNLFVLGVTQAVLFPRTGVVDPDGLYQMRYGPRTSGALVTTSHPAFEDFRRRNHTFGALAGYYGYSSAALHWRNMVRRVTGYEVTGNYFELLGVQPAIGRFFDAADERRGPVVVLSDQLWRSAFQADPAVVGATATLNEQAFTVVGVAPPRFRGTERLEAPDYWIPLAYAALVRGGVDLESRERGAVAVIGRLRPGVSERQATDDLNAIGAQLAREYPKTDRPVQVRLVHAGLFGDDGEVIRESLSSVVALALFLLLAACVNLASLSAARVADRGRELALRIALGSSRLRLARQLLSEAALVALLGGAAGSAGAYALLAMLGRWEPSFGYGGQPLAIGVGVDARLALTGLLLTLGSGLLSGMVPARRAWQGSPSQLLKGGPPPAAVVGPLGVGDVLLGVQIAICTLLVTASLVAVRGRAQAMEVPLGFQPEGAMLARVDLGPVVPDGAAALATQRQMMDAARSIPGVTAVGAAVSLPMGGGRRGVPVHRPGATDVTANDAVLSSRVYPVSPGYLEAAGTRRLQGRDVSWQDVADAPRVAVVNDTFARAMWGASSAIGERFLLAGRLTEVVGLAENGKYHDLMETPQAAVFLPLPQSPAAEVTFVVRSTRAPDDVAAAVQRTLNAVEPNAPVTLRTWPEALGHVRFPARVATLALGLMGFLASMLAVTGIFGMAAYIVSRRQKDLAIRAALGADGMAVVRAAVGRPALLLAIGSTLGVLGSALTTRLLDDVVYRADPSHPAVLLGGVATMVALGIAGAAIPALRALAIDPGPLMKEG